MASPVQPADFTVIRRDRLVAYVWRREGGHLRNAGTRGEEPICEVGFADVVCYQSQEVELLTAIVQRARDLDGCLFELRLEGFRIEPGAFSPHANMRRF